MRPHRLTMTAFGPYAGVETIDFTMLGDSAFFLIHGPTGSGKTSILDAVCFSLFGKTSGELRDGKQMRSDYVDSSIATSVVFDFTLGAESYRIFRSPEQEVHKKRGSGTTKMLSAATLWKRTGLASDSEDGVVMASRWEKVTEAAETLLGFKYEQFRQVVMLPQGEFRRLLLANSKDREAILANLFQTELYRRIEEFLKQRAKLLAEDIKELADKKRWTLEQSGATDAEDLLRQTTELSQLGNHMAEQITTAQQTLSITQEKFAAAKLLKSHFEEKRQVEQQRSILLGKQQHIDSLRREASQASKAQNLADLCHQVSQRQLEYKQAEERLQAAEKQVAAAKAAEKHSLEVLQAEQAREKERAESARRVQDLTVLKSKVLQLAAAIAEYDQAAAAAAKALAFHAEIKAKVNLAANQLEQNRKSHDLLKNHALQLSAKQAACLAAEQFVIYQEKRGKLLEKYRRIDLEEKTAQKQFTTASAALETAREEYKRLQDDWRRGQAAEMARDLRDGQSCPVCGSIHHPSPALISAQTVTSTDLEAKSKQISEFEQYLDTLRKPLSELALQKNSIETEGKSIREMLGDKADQGLEQLRETLALAKTELANAQDAASKIALSGQKLADCEQDIIALQNQLQSAEENLRRQNAAQEAAKAIVLERENPIPENLRNASWLATELEKAALANEKLLQDWQTAQQKAEQSGREVESIKATHAAAREFCQTALSQLQAEKAKLFKRLTEAGFQTEEELLAAVRPTEEIAKLESIIKEYGETLLLLEDRIKRAAQVTSGRVEPEMEVFTTELAAAQAAYDQLIAAQAKLLQSSQKMKQWLDETVRLENALANREKDFAVLGNLADVANGQNQARISFQRFVLATLLEDVMLAANIRLKKMSRGRYVLRRMTDPLHRGSAGGLDIEIEDNYTGSTRHVATLSGGETFLASLSLALGLADVVQSFSGGINLDTIFVDEGFGTLDPESLDMAIQTLIELRQNGRLVGIISHVPELKERIENRLEIVPTERGSTTRWS